MRVLTLFRDEAARWTEKLKGGDLVVVKNHPDGRKEEVFIHLFIYLCVLLIVHSFPILLVGLVVKASASGAEDPGFESRLRRDFSRVESYQ